MASNEKRQKLDETKNTNNTKGNNSDQYQVPFEENTKTLVERNNELFETGLLADVKFIFQNTEAENDKPEEFLAHKIILSVGSPVFNRMFSSTWNNSKSNEIDIDFNQKEAFIEMLRYIYTDNVNVSLKNISMILYLAKQYLIPNLQNLCRIYLRKNLTPAIALQIYEAIKFDENASNECFTYIQNDTKKIVSSSYFCNISKDTLIEILKMEILSISEFDLFQSVSKWISKQCENLKLPFNDENKISLFADSIYLIRFPLMTFAEFNSCMETHSSLLTTSDIIQLQNYFNGNITENLKFSFVERQLSAVVNNFNYEKLKDIFNEPPIQFLINFGIQFECECEEDIVLLGITVLAIASYSLVIGYKNDVQYVEVPETKDFYTIYLNIPISMNKIKHYSIILFSTRKFNPSFDLCGRYAQEMSKKMIFKQNYNSTVHVNNIKFNFTAPDLVQKIHFRKSYIVN